MHRRMQNKIWWSLVALIFSCRILFFVASGEWTNDDPMVFNDVGSNGRLALMLLTNVDEMIICVFEMKWEWYSNHSHLIESCGCLLSKKKKKNVFLVRAKIWGWKYGKWPNTQSLGHDAFLSKRASLKEVFYLPGSQAAHYNLHFCIRTESTATNMLGVQWVYSILKLGFKTKMNPVSLFWGP